MTANGNKTVVITTHYIEEARQAHTVSNYYECICGCAVNLLEILIVPKDDSGTRINKDYNITQIFLFPSNFFEKLKSVTF